MKKYMEYMDSVRASDTLHQRLLGLEAAGKRPVAWKKYGALAAALVLVVGAGAWGLAHGGWNALADRFRPDSRPETAELDGPDIAIVEPGDVTEPGEKTLGGYEVTSGSGPNAMVTHYILPYIEYGTVEAAQAKIALDWVLGEGFTEGPVSQEEIVALLGGEDVLSDHLDWDGYDLFGWRYDRADGTPGLVMISGYKGELDHFEFSLMYGELPPTCIAYPDSVTQEVRGLTVTADKYDGKYGSDRRVSFMKDDWGYRFDVTATDAQQAELLASRLVRHVADRGLELSVVGGAIPEFAPDYDPTYEDGVPNQDGTPVTETCPNCGAAYPAGSEHDCAMCDGYPIAHVCEICGETYPEGTAHSHEACGYPLAPDTRICEVCGETIPAGMNHDCAATHICQVCGQTLPAGAEHSHQQNHHQEQHHGGHH